MVLNINMNMQSTILLLSLFIGDVQAGEISKKDVSQKKLSSSGAGVMKRHFEIDQLKMTYGADVKLCEYIKNEIRAMPTCRAFDLKPDNDICDVDKKSDGERNYWNPVRMQQISLGRYGYSRVMKAVNDGNDLVSILYVDLFINDRHDRVVETWVVNNLDLKYFFDLDVPTQNEYKNSSGVGAIKNDEHEFKKFLSRGKKISDEWSPAMLVNNEIYLIERQCAGRWNLADNYKCEKIKRINVIHVFPNNLNVKKCEFSQERKK